MDLWMWLLAYLLGFSLLQLLLYRYFSRDVPHGETTTPASGEHPTARLNGGTDTSTTAGTVCPNCGAENEPDAVYTYCQECLSRLQ